MTTLRRIKQHIMLVVFSAIIYFCFDYFIIQTSFLHVYSFVGLKSFLPMVLGLNFGIYGVIGELIAVSIKCYLIHSTMNFFLMECIIVIIIGIGAWYLWHINSVTYRIHLRFVQNYVRYILIIVTLSLICACISRKMINQFAFDEIMIWNISMSILVGIPIEIIYGSLMNLDPILPPLYINGKRIELNDDLKYTITADVETFQSFNMKVEELLERENVDMRRTFEIQNIVEEMYLRIINKYPKAVIDVKANYDITFSIEFLFIEKKYNPFIIKKTETTADAAGLKIVKHKALLASYYYDLGLNYVHIVI